MLDITRGSPFKAVDLIGYVSSAENFVITPLRQPRERENTLELQVSMKWGSIVTAMVT